MPGLFSIKKSGEKPREIKTKITVDFSQGEKISQLEIIRQKIQKEKEKKEKL